MKGLRRKVAWATGGVSQWSWAIAPLRARCDMPMAIEGDAYFQILRSYAQRLLSSGCCAALLLVAQTVERFECTLARALEATPAIGPGSRRRSRARCR